MPYTTEAQICRDALAVQDACNLSGVLRSFHEAALWLLSNTKCTDSVNTHPAMKLFADKVASMTGMQGNSMTAFSRAYDRCKELAG